MKALTTTEQEQLKKTVFGVYQSYISFRHKGRNKKWKWEIRSDRIDRQEVQGIWG